MDVLYFIFLKGIHLVIGLYVRNKEYSFARQAFLITALRDSRSKTVKDAYAKK